MTSNIIFNGELSHETMREFAKYIIPFIREFVFSEEGKNLFLIGCVIIPNMRRTFFAIMWMTTTMKNRNAL